MLLVVSRVGVVTALELTDKHLDNLMEESEDCRPEAVSVAGAGAFVNMNRRYLAHVN